MSSDGVVRKRLALLSGHLLYSTPSCVVDGSGHSDNRWMCLFVCRYSDREGGYCRVLRTMSRKGDNAPMGIIELV
jgi:hypothetical protein